MEETVMICFDDSAYMKFYEPHRFMLQIQCIRLYCQLQIKSNPKIAIGILKMGSRGATVILHPTSDIDKILHAFHYAHASGGGCRFIGGIMTSMNYFGKQSKQKRIVMFTGSGYVIGCTEMLEYYGKLVKDRDIDVQLFNFLLNRYQEESKVGLEVFAAAAGANCVHVLAEPDEDLDSIINRYPQFLCGFSPDKDQLSEAKNPKGEADELELASNNEPSSMRGDWEDSYDPEETIIIPMKYFKEVPPMSGDEFTPPTGSSKRKNETPPGAIDVEGSSKKKPN